MARLADEAKAKADAEAEADAARRKRDALIQQQAEEARRNMANYRRYLAEKAAAEAAAARPPQAPAHMPAAPPAAATQVPASTSPEPAKPSPVEPAKKDAGRPLAQPSEGTPAQTPAAPAVPQTEPIGGIDLSRPIPKPKAPLAAPPTQAPARVPAPVPTPPPVEQQAQPAPVRAGVEERNAKWERLFERIAAEKLYIVAAGDGDRLIVATFSEEGALSSNPTLYVMKNDQQSEVTEPDDIEQSAIDALVRCAPIKLPPALYAYWQQIEVELFPAMPKPMETDNGG